MEPGHKTHARCARSHPEAHHPRPRPRWRVVALARLHRVLLSGAGAAYWRCAASRGRRRHPEAPVNRTHFALRFRPAIMDDWGMKLRERWRDYWSPREQVDTSPRVSDEVKYTTCYMCACRCGIKVHLKDGGIRFIEGNPRHPVNRGVICGKGASGIMQHYSPARLSKPLLRAGERGAGEFREIEWDEAIATAVDWLSKIRTEDPRKPAFSTGRHHSQSLTGRCAW